MILRFIPTIIVMLHLFQTLHVIYMTSFYDTPLFIIVSVDAMEAQDFILPACEHPGPRGLALTMADDWVQQCAMTASILLVHMIVALF